MKDSRDRTQHAHPILQDHTNEEHVKRLGQITRGACNPTIFDCLDWFIELADHDGGGAWPQSLSLTAECPNTEKHVMISPKMVQPITTTGGYSNR